MKQEEIPVEKLYKKLENTLSDAADKEVEEWLKIPSHRSYFEHLKQFHQLNERQKASEADVQNAWEAMLKRINKETSGSRRVFVWISALAASVLVGWGIWSLFPLPLEHEMTKPEVVQILPGKVQAILELANGNTYDLQENFVQTISKNILLDSGRLNYIQSDTGCHDQLVMNKLSIPRGGEFQLVFEDGTKVWLNAESMLKYPQTFPATSREVWLDGEAYFEVAKDAQRPFIVHSGVQKITVLGTSFGITAYPEEDRFSTTLVDGKVQVEYSGNTKEVYSLQPGERVLYHSPSNTIRLEKVDVREFVAWKDGRYVFSRRRLEDMLNTLSRWYDFDVFFRDPRAKEIVFSGELKRFESFDDILKMIEKSSEVQFSVQGHTVMVK